MDDPQITYGMFCIPSSITNKMQRYTVFFIAVNAVHVLGGFSTPHQELKIQNSPTLTVAASKLDTYQMLCVQF
jgi:predicted transcriptional regulator